jgi:nucleoid DNA-binding protein
MKKEQLARRLAKESHMTAGAAADQVDRILNNLAKRVRKGQSASLPGLGTFRSNRDEDFKFDGSLPPVADRAKSKKERQ